jgi:hypothetical protein
MLHREETKWSEEDDGYVIFERGDTYEMIRCCGCQTVALRHQFWTSTDPDASRVIQTNYYPPATYRKEPEWLSHANIRFLHSFICDLFREIYIALRNSSNRLAVMGIRALLEYIMIDKVGDQGSFRKNIDEFESKGFVSNSQRAVLDSVLEAGHAAIHRGWNPSREELVPLIDITENIVETIYLNEMRAKKVSDKVRPRGKRDA